MEDENINPSKVFKTWYEEASSLDQYNAMFLATSTSSALPSVRTVLLKQYSDLGFTFYTNTKSKKGSDLLSNPHAEILFFWKELNRQIRIRGVVNQIEEEESDKYFALRKRGSQISAWASQQSLEMEDENELEKRYQELEKKFINKENIPRPQFWSGFILIPNRFEFWQEGKHRLHSRYQYKLVGNKWERSKLYP